MQAAPPPEPPQVPIIVTARALPDPAADRAYAVDRIDQRRLTNSPSTQLDQILKDVPGLQLFRRSDARSGHPTSQGVTLRALGGNASSRALLILDGVPQTDPFGGWVNWPAYDPASLAEVRVIRGGGSVANGPGALAGTIEMRSRLQDIVAADAWAGSRQSLEGRVFAGVPVGGGTLGLSGRAARGDGYTLVTEGTRGPADRPAPYKEASLRAYWAVPVTSDVDLQLSGLGFIDRRDRGVDFTENHTDGADGSIRLVGHGRWQWSATGYYQWRELESSFASVSAGRATATRVSLQDSVPSHAIGGSFEVRPPLGGGIELRLGGDVRSSEGESRELYSYVAGEPTRRRRAGGDSVTAGLFGEATADLGRLTLSGGARIDRWTISDGKLVEWVIATGAPLRDDQYPNRSGWRPTARGGGVLDVGGGFSLRSAAYLGWRLPTLNELFRPFRAGSDATAANALLDPERLRGAEAGVRFDRSGVTLSATAFANRLSDAIANVTLGEGPGTFPGVGFVGPGGTYRQRQNLDAVRVRGIEASAEIRHGSLSANLGASFTDAEVEGSGPAAELDGLRPAQTPKVALTAGFAWENRGRALSFVVRHVGSQFEDDLNEDKLKPATTLDAFAAWPITRQLQLVARGENLFNELIEAGIGGDGSIERATPRTLWVGLRFNSGR
ncbi:TonB-dependent receptor [Sphingomonas sp. SM33]|uniref:TonB-dependent receptor n=1 Tax=Sphingomonas telluris TaxID=2907998 RepID=A0ABS9VRI9_9SPHN|nr:TonB-dependent receptor [Sphingomonas telluris]MCH8617403.1 TonB-dependent receptor [Sphingomonas telluris]